MYWFYIVNYLNNYLDNSGNYLDNLGFMLINYLGRTLHSKAPPSQRMLQSATRWMGVQFEIPAHILIRQVASSYVCTIRKCKQIT